MAAIAVGHIRLGTGRARLVVLMSILVLLSVLQISFFHVYNPILDLEGREISDSPFFLGTAQRSFIQQEPLWEKPPTETSKIEERENRPDNKVKHATKTLKIVQNSTMGPPRFDILARRLGPKPKFPSDFVPTGDDVIDILQNASFDLSALQPLNLTLRTEMLGILIDAGRHFFPVAWLKRLMDVMHVLQFNLLHLRLTDDQAFAIQLESQPNLTYPTHIYGNDKVYTRANVKELLQHARTKGIWIVPEINVPGHSAAWMGIPGLVVPCHRLACQKGYGVPLNASHPNIRKILTDVIGEVINIFGNPPYLHLGGDEIELAKPCFDELGEDFFDYNIFESLLKEILADVGYPEDQVIRWRETDFAAEAGIKTKIKREVRAGKINHWWHDTPGKTENVTAGTHIIGSARLYMDVNEMEAAWEVFLHSRKWWHVSDVFAQNAPLNLRGLIVGAFELGTDFFHHRNVIGRMLAVTIGASDIAVHSGNQVNELYAGFCKEARFPDELCRKYGSPIVDWRRFKAKWQIMWAGFKKDICQRFPASISH